MAESNTIPLTQVFRYGLVLAILIFFLILIIVKDYGALTTLSNILILTPNDTAEQFNGTVQETVGHILTSNQNKCSVHHFPNYTAPGPKCMDTIGLRTLCIENLVKSKFAVGKGELMISIVTQLSCERLDLLHLLSIRWKDTISAIIFTSDSHGCSPEKIQFGISLAKNHTKMDLNLVRSPKQLLYPFNALRYLAAELSPASHYLYLDTDLMPSPTLHDELMAHLKTQLWLNNTKLIKPIAAEDKIAFIVPAFDYVKPNKDNIQRVIKSREELIDLWESKIIKPIRIDVWKPGHGPTDFPQWKITESDYEVPYQYMFEPYVLVPREAPKPDVRFVGADKDKIAFVLQLHAAKYSTLYNVYMQFTTS